MRKGTLLKTISIVSLVLCLSLYAVPQQAYAQEKKTSNTVTINVSSASIVDVLNAFSQQTGKNIVVGKDVKDVVTARLQNVPWEEALNSILKPYGYTYQKIGNTIIVSPMDEMIKGEQVETLVSRVYTLNFLDANDIKEIIETRLSPRGKVAVLAMKGQKGWEFGSESQSQSSNSGDNEGVGASGKRKRIADKDTIKSKILVVTDILSVHLEIAEMIKEVDVRPAQILIESRFMEVNNDVLTDIGLDFGTGSDGAGYADLGNTNEMAIQTLGAEVAPSIFNSASTGLSNTQPYNTGLNVLFRKLAGTEYNILLHAVEEYADTNTLSAPSILTLNNQEASILVGTKYPILKSDVLGTTTAFASVSLDYYQDIGIQLNVVPQVCSDNYINMIIHPAVTSQSGTVSAQTSDEITLATYPIITSRETETQILVQSGDTIMIGGLMKDVASGGQFKIPILGYIPGIGKLFTRDTTDTQKIDLLIFITAKIVTEDVTVTQDPVFAVADDGSSTIAWGKDIDTIKKGETAN